MKGRPVETKYDVSIPLRQILNDLDRKIIDLSRRIGWDYSNLQKLIRGEILVSSATVIKLAQKLRVPVETLAILADVPERKEKHYERFSQLPLNQQCGMKRALEIVGEDYLDSNQSGVVSIGAWEPNGGRRLGGHGMTERNLQGGC